MMDKNSFQKLLYFCSNSLLMKQILALVLLGIFLFSCSQNKVKNDLIKKNLICNVMTITESGYLPIEKFGEFQKGRGLTKIITKYDENGNDYRWQLNAKSNQYLPI